MRDGFRLVGRIPYPATEPKHLIVASEVATLDFLRSHGMPVPKVYGYSTTSDHPTGTEYIFMELIRGTNLGDIWFSPGEKARITAVTKLVELEARLFALRFAASGSLYYAKDLEATYDRVDLDIEGCAGNDRLCVGPDTRLRLWYRKRLHIQTDRALHCTARKRCSCPSNVATS